MVDAAVETGSCFRLQGLWRRHGRSVGGGPRAEVSRVVWAQVGDWFADVRAPTSGNEGVSWLDEAQAFSGVVRCTPTIVTWCHDLDTVRNRKGRLDTAVVEGDSDTLIERGSEYEELWKREDSGGPAAVLERRTPDGVLRGRLVTVGGVYVAVWAGRRPGGASVHVSGEGWEIETRIGSGAIPWAAVIETWSGRLPAGWERVA